MNEPGVAGTGFGLGTVGMNAMLEFAGTGFGLGTVGMNDPGVAGTGVGLGTVGMNDMLGFAGTGFGLGTVGMNEPGLAGTGVGLGTVGMNEPGVAGTGLGLGTVGIIEFETGRVVGAATALTADTANTEPRATHETFNHGRIRIIPQLERKPAATLTEKGMPGTTKVLKLLQKKLRYRLLVPHNGKMGETVARTSRYHLKRGQAAIGYNSHQLQLAGGDRPRCPRLIPELRARFNANHTPAAYQRLLALLAERCGGPVQFRVAETPIFVTKATLDEMAALGAAMAQQLMDDPEYLAGARRAIPAGYDVAGQTGHSHFLTADFALVRTAAGELVPRLVEIQAFPSVFAYQVELCAAYREVFGLSETLGVFLGGLDEGGYWELLRRTIVGDHDPESVVLTEVDPLHQKTFPDFELTRRRLEIAVVDISSLEPEGSKLYYRDAAGRRIQIERIYNRAIADELIARGIKLPFDLAQPWEVEWAGHPNWYFLISKYSIPFLARSGGFPEVPPACFVDEFLAGPGMEFLQSRGVDLEGGGGGEAGYESLLLKPLFSFAGKGIEFSPTRDRLEAIAKDDRKNYILQQRMHFEPTVETPFGLTQAEIRILYLWPDGGTLTPAISLVRLGRGKMMGVDHNKNKEWVGGSAAFYV